MAKIDSKWFKFQSDHVKVDIFYTHKDHFFAKNVPDDVKWISEANFSGFDKEFDLIEALRSAFRLYHEKIKKSRKVIAYSFDMTAELCMKKVRSGEWHGYKDWVPDNFRGPNMDRASGVGDGYGFGIEWEVYMEVMAEETSYHSIRPDGTLGYKEEGLSGKQVIDWTQEREEALRGVYASMEEMVKRVVKILGEPKAFTKMLDSGTKLLSYSPGRRKKRG